MNNLNSFTLHAVGTLARGPEIVTKGDISFVRFCLTGSNYDVDGDGLERPVASHLWFDAFAETAEELIKHSHKGDQLIVQALCCGASVTKDGHTLRQINFVVTGLAFGAKGRNGGNSSQASTPPPRPPSPPDDSTAEERTIAVA